MTDPTGPVVLHAPRCIGFADLSRVADAAGLREPDVESHLIDLSDAHARLRDVTIVIDKPVGGSPVG